MSGERGGEDLYLRVEGCGAGRTETRFVQESWEGGRLGGQMVGFRAVRPERVEWGGVMLGFGAGWFRCFGDLSAPFLP